MKQRAQSRFSWIPTRLSTKAWILVVIPLAFEIAFVSVLSFLLFQVETEARNMERSRNLIMEMENLQRLFVEAGTSAAGYSLSKNPDLSARFYHSKSKVIIQMGLLKDLVRNDPELSTEVTTIGNMLQNELVQLDKIFGQIDRDTGGSKSFESIQGSYIQLANLFEDAVKRQRMLIKDGPSTESKLSESVTICLLIGLGFNVSLAVVLVAFFNAGTTKRLAVLMDNTSRLSRQQELLPSVGGRDEIAKLDRVFHSMSEALANAARRERAVVYNAFDVICSIDRDLKFSAVNPASERQWGYSENELRGRRVVDIIFTDTEEVTKSFRDSIDDKSTRAIEIRIRAKNQRPVDTLWTLRWSDSEKQLVCVSHDITERKRADQIRKDVVAMVSHDLRSPLTSILVGIDFLKSGASGTISKPVDRELDKMAGGASRMVRLINDFLDLEKLQSGKIELKPARTNLDVLVNNSVQGIQSLAAVKEIEFREVDTDIDLIVDGDRIMQVLINLLSNATKFSPRGGVITIAAAKFGNNIEISVTDQGPGIEPAHQAAIFETFTQLENGVMPNSSGLGLAICRNLVELHGGTIGVRSEVGKGSTFWFQIPQLSEEH